MKKDIHPENYRPVIFEDNSSGARFLIASTVKTDEKGKWIKSNKSGSPDQPVRVGLGEDGKEYPLHKVEISSASHPFYTGQSKTIDTAGRVEKFKKRQEAASKGKK
jgi:large subunit ribosomal protein L31